MTPISLERILELLRDGLYSGCVALIVEAENRHCVLRLLEKLVVEQYGRMQVMILDSEAAINSPLESFDGDLLFVDGLSKIGPQDQ